MECRDYCSLTDVIPNTAPKCCVPPQSLSEGLFKKQPRTTGLLCALFLVYSQHKFKAESCSARSQQNLCRQFSRFTLMINTAKRDSYERKGPGQVIRMWARLMIHLFKFSQVDIKPWQIVHVACNLTHQSSFVS